MLEDALLRGKEAYSFLLDINHKGVVVNIAPILVDSQIEGAGADLPGRPAPDRYGQRDAP